MTRKSGKYSVLHTEDNTAISTLIGLISSVYHDLQPLEIEPVITESKRYHWAISQHRQINAKLTSHRKCATT